MAEKGLGYCSCVTGGARFYWGKQSLLAIGSAQTCKMQ
jgi:hypothetical protein